MANPKLTPTMHEVAKEAKTSIATVSRVINGNQTVSPKLEKRVRKAMAKLRYHPSSVARSLKMQESRMVGVLVPLLEHPGYSQMASSIEKRLFDRDYRGLICDSYEDEDRENAYIESLLRQRVAGIILNSSARNPAYIADLQENNIPLVLFDRSIKELNCNQVYFDNFRGGYMAIEHLHSLGHERIGILAAPDYPEVIVRRLRGAKQAVADFGLDDDPELVITGDTQLYDMGYQAGQVLLQLQPRPTAIFALTDVTAVGVLHAAAEMNVSVPHEVSVIGYDDLPVAKYMLPTLTTIAQPFYKMGDTAVDLLLRSIREPDAPPKDVILDTTLVVRDSTAPR